MVLQGGDIVAKNTEKRKMTRNERRKIITKILTWIIVIIMVFGTLISLLYPLIFL